MPGAFAQRSDVIAELYKHDDSSNVDMPVPFSIAEVKAWLVCAQACTAAEDGHSGTQLMSMRDKTLLDALRVSFPQIYINDGHDICVLMITGM